MTGRPRKPVEEQTGHRKIVELQKRAREQEAVTVPDDQLDTPPDWLISDLAREEWRRLMCELKRISIVGNLDLNNLGAYCNAYASYRDATDQLAEEALTIAKHTNTGTNIVENPLINIQRKYADEMRRFGRLCGLDIDSRLRAGGKKIEQEDNSLEKRFGI